MTPLRQQMTAALELNGKSPATVEAYVREVALVAKFYRKRPDLISEEELVRYRSSHSAPKHYPYPPRRLRRAHLNTG